MTLAEGTRLAPYEIAVALGAGEIGEAYRPRVFVTLSEAKHLTQICRLPSPNP
jgi:hypothetical protein